ncbi:OmpH family outer membrane protein [Halothermothrix orenii]|uniref:Outer membrane chaperone Skp (OmpH) n=1 Tax=Halothermothrix orenii (strain H 168 / OCM 544 / DSM 9562) TaxID=373903 RepID=B8CYZ7_HALOH|nr:OmpH family outer membrane protein [Halothermothrix orenii]ACL70516.1 outer membrane chaperone Skp (OmpH) [Halothermothrix orenii H 168]
MNIKNKLVKNKLGYPTIILITVLVITFLFNPISILKAGDEAEGKIAYVDVQAVFNEHPEKVKAEKELNQLAQSMQAELEEKAKNLPESEQQELVNEYQMKLTRQEQEMIHGLLVKIDKAIKIVAEQKKVRLVLDKKNVIYGGYDLTQDVIDYIKENYEETEKGVVDTDVSLDDKGNSRN